MLKINDTSLESVSYI